MADDRHLREFAEIDYCLRKYYNEHFSSILSSTIKEVNQKKAEEFGKILKDTPSLAGAGMPDAAARYAILKSQNAEWGSKTTDDMMKMASDRMIDGKAQKDIGVIVEALQIKLVERLGKERYSELSAHFGRDLAHTMVISRLDDLMMEQVARSKLPKSSMDYIMKKGFSESLVGVLTRLQSMGNYTSTDAEISEMVEKMYNPSGAEKVAGHGVGFLLDTPSLGLWGSWSGKFIENSLGAALDGGFRVYDEMTREKVYSSKQLSEMVFGEKDYMDRVGSASRKVNAADADYVELINGYLDQKMVLPFNGHRASRNTAVFESVAEGSGSQALENVRSTLKEYGLAYLPQKKVPEWMMRKCSEETCIKNAGYYLGIAQEMNAKGRKSIRIGTREMTLKEVTQQAYDYARAADLKHQVVGPTEKERLIQGVEAGEAELSGMGLLNDQPRDVTDSQILQHIRASLHKNGLAYAPDKAWPKWMDAMSQDKLEYEAKRWRNIAVQMQNQKKTEQDFKGVGKMTLQDVAQRAYDYARAADVKFKADREERRTTKDMEEEWDRNMAAINAANEMPDQQTQRDPNIHYAVDMRDTEGQQAAYAKPAAQQYVYSYEPAPANGARRTQMTPETSKSWERHLDSLGLGSFSKFGSNLGSTIAMLPELMVGMFTGKIPGFSLKDNALPLGLLVMSLLFGRRMNPLLKFMMLGLGGAMLLNNAGKVLRGENTGSPERARTYRRYNDEPLSPRLSNVEMKGNTILADIDGVPTVLTIKSDRVLDAYNKGAIPLNTLCNAVLRSYDQMEVKTVQNYEKVASQQLEEQQLQVRGIR